MNYKDNPKVDKISDLKNILLAKYAGGIKNTPIFKFSEYLFAHPNLPKLDIIKDYESLNEYIDSNRENIKNIISSLDNPNYNSKQNVYPYLLVVARPFGNDLFYLEAELIIYYCQDKPTSYYQDNPTRYKLPIDNDENIDTHGKICCSFKDIANKILYFVEQSRKFVIIPKKLTCRHQDMTIELFLSVLCLGKNIDIQKVCLPYEGNKGIGAHFKFVLRSIERLPNNDPMDDSVDQLKTRWESLKTICRDKEHLGGTVEQGYIHHITDSNFDDFTSDLKKDPNKIGIKITCKLTKTSEKKLFKMIIKTGLPICLWTRSNKIQDLEFKINNILTWKSLNSLSELFDSVRETRDNTKDSGNKKQEQLAYNLGFLCDNPDRVPAFVGSSLITTGE